MKKYNRIYSYNQKYAKELKLAIEKIKPKMIQAFVNIYGIEHYEYIKNTINNLEFIYFVPNKDLKYLNNFDSNIRKRDRYILEYYLRYLKYLDYVSIGISETNINRFILENYIAYAEISYENLGYIPFIDLLEQDCALYTSIVNIEEQKEYKLIMLPIYTCNILTIFHEINHALTIDTIGYLEEGELIVALFDNVTEELTNDYIANLALNEFHKLGGTIPSGLKRFSYLNNYQIHSYIVKYLFENLEPLILKAKITKNYNLFIKLVGHEKYLKLQEYIEKLYLNCYNEEIYLELMNLLDIIYERVVNTKFYEYDYEALINEGYLVRKLKES